MAYSKIILNGETLMDVTSDTVDAGNLLSGETATKNSGAKVTGNIASKSSSDLTASGATVTVPSGYYSAQASKSVDTMTLPQFLSSTKSGTFINGISQKDTVQYLNIPKGYNSTAQYYQITRRNDVMAGTPTATKGSVSNHSVSVTPSVTNTEGYISGGTINGTAVTVSASELVSGTYTVDSSGTKDVTNYASASISALTLPSALTNSAEGTMVATINLPNGVNKYLQIPKGYNNTNSYYQFEVPTGTAGTPTASKGTVNNHSVSVTPSVTNTTGYIIGSTKTGTPVTVSASELVSGTKSITANGTGIDVTDYASIDVSVTPSFTATLTSSGASANVYVKHNNTKYYTSGDTFSFSAGDTLVIVCMQGDSNYFNLNGATVAGGYGKDVDNYNWTMPPGNISIALTAQNGSSRVDITASGIPTLITKSITQNGTYDAEDDNADGYSSVTVNVSGGGASNLVQGTFTTSATEGTTQTVNIPYTGNGYPISLSVFPSEGTYKNGGTAYNTVKQYAVWYFNASKCYPDTAPTYDGSGTSDTAMTLVRYKNSSSSSTRMSNSAVNNTTVYNQTPGNSSVTQVIKISSATTLSVLTASTTYGLLPSTEYTYVMSYSS